MTACPVETFPTVAAAESELLERRARAALSGTDHYNRHAWHCDSCGQAHITRADNHLTDRGEPGETPWTQATGHRVHA